MIFEAISANKEMICGELVALRGVTPATVSHHLEILADAGLIECRREGQCVHNSVVPQTIAEDSRALAPMARGKNSSSPPEFPTLRRHPTFQSFSPLQPSFRFPPPTSLI